MSQVARRYNANTNLIFAWLHDPRFAPDKATEATESFLRVEIDLPGGHRLRITGP